MRISKHDIFMNCSFSYQKILLFYLESEVNKYLSSPPFSEKFSSSLRDLTFTSAELRDFQLRGPFSSVTHLMLSVLHFFITDFGSKVSQLPPISIILNIFNKCLTPREQRKLILTRFNCENIPSSLASETRAVNNNLIISSTSLHPLLLGAVENLRHVARYKTPARKRVFFVYSTNSYHCYKKIGN